MNYDDVREIFEIDKIWAAWRAHWFMKYVVGPPLLVIVVLLGILTVVVPFLGSAVLIVILLGVIIIRFISAEDPGAFSVYLLFAIVLFILASVPVVSIFWALVHGDSEDLRYLVRFKILPPTGMDSSTYYFDPIEVVLLTLKGKESWTGLRKYKRESPDSNQLDLIRIYLWKKYQRDVSEDECLRFFSMGIMHIYKRGRKSADEVRYSFVVLDEKTEELLFCSNGHNDWPYVSEVLEESGLILFDISETVVDMNRHVINEDGSIETILISS